MDSRASYVLPGAFVSTGGGAGYVAPGTAVEFDCRLASADTAQARELVVAGQLEGNSIQVMFYPLDEAVVPTDANLTVDGVAYEVVGLVPLGTYDRHRRALVRARQVA